MRLMKQFRQERFKLSVCITFMKGSMFDLFDCNFYHLINATVTERLTIVITKTKIKKRSLILLGLFCLYGCCFAFSHPLPPEQCILSTCSNDLKSSTSTNPYSVSTSETVTHSLNKAVKFAFLLLMFEIFSAEHEKLKEHANKGSCSLDI